MQAPGGPQEDTSGGFEFGGWTVPYFDEMGGKIMAEQMSVPFDLLLGRKTYDIFAAYWPRHNDADGGAVLNAATKYVATRGDLNPTWEKTVILDHDAAHAVKKLKEEEGPMLQVHGSSEFIQTLLKHDLVDELWLKIFPLTLGKGKKLFGEGTIPHAFTLTDFKVTPSGIIAANYTRAGEVKTGSF